MREPRVGANVFRQGKTIHLRHLNVAEDALDLIHAFFALSSGLIREGLQFCPGLPPVVVMM